MSPFQKIIFLIFSIFFVTGMAYVNIFPNECSTNGNFYMLFLTWLTLINFALFLISGTKFLGLGILSTVTILYVYIASFVRSKGVCTNFIYIENTTLIPFILLKFYSVYQYIKKRIKIYEKYGGKINENIAKKIINKDNYSQKNNISVLSAHINTKTALYGDVDKNKIQEIMESIEKFTDNLIMEFDGTIEKLNGKEIIAYWGQPTRQKNHAQIACNTVLEIQKKLNKFNKRKTILELEIIAGIRTDIATERQMGKKINEAKILEDLNNYYKTNILIGKQTISKLNEQFIIRHIDTINYNNQFKNLMLYELIGIIDGDLDTPFVPDEDTRNIIKNHKRALKLYQKGDFKNALELFETNYREFDDLTALVFIDRIEKMKKAPKGWDGVFEFIDSEKK